MLELNHEMTEKLFSVLSSLTIEEKLVLSHGIIIDQLDRLYKRSLEEAQYQALKVGQSIINHGQYLATDAAQIEDLKESLGVEKD